MPECLKQLVMGFASCPMDADSRPKTACKQRYRGSEWHVLDLCQADGLQYNYCTLEVATALLGTLAGLLPRRRRPLRPKHGLIEVEGKVNSSLCRQNTASSEAEKVEQTD